MVGVAASHITGQHVGVAHFFGCEGLLFTQAPAQAEIVDFGLVLIYEETKRLTRYACQVSQSVSIAQIIPLAVSSSTPWRIHA